MQKNTCNPKINHILTVQSSPRKVSSRMNATLALEEGGSDDAGTGELVGWHWEFDMARLCRRVLGQN